MKKLFCTLFPIFLITFLFSACQQHKFTIEGTIEGAQDSVLYFRQMSLSGPVLLDSVKLPADGRFKFTADAPDAPEFYVLHIHDQLINISVDSVETITVRAKYPGMAANYEVEGSDNCEKIRELALKQQDLYRRAVALERNFGLSRSEQLDSLQRMLNSYKQDVTRNYIFREPNKAYAYFALFQALGPQLIFDPKSNRDDVKAFAAVATSWDTYYPGAERGENLHNIALEGMKNVRLTDARNMQQIDYAKVVESGVLDLHLTDNRGHERTLTELKGQVVLLDFHTFQLENSPQRILMLRELYNKYHAQGFEIYQVSLDRDEHFWKQMTSQLPWVSVHDAEGQSAATYNVQAVPEFFIIDRQNRLQKRSSQMTDLEGEIKALL